MAEMKQIDSLWLGADIVTMRDGHYNLIADGALAVDNGELIWVGSRSEMPDFTARQQHTFDGGIITPGLVDCHTHLVFAGDRSEEFEQRLNGVSYADIAAQGGGILSTVRATRAATQQELVRAARWRLDRLLAEGVTTVEIKSGYGLDEQSELTMLRAIRELAQSVPADVRATCLAAHGFPPEFKDNPQGWIDIICERLLPQVKAAGLADAVDAFCEHLAFSPQQVRTVFDCAHALGLPVKLHAEQLSALGGAALAASYGALSADHLEYATEADAR
ncbi:imidazolonepropionase, partial [Pantoea wallisii]